MKAGISSVPHQLSPNHGRPRRCRRDGRKNTFLNRRPTWTLPRPHRSRCFHNATMPPGSSARHWALPSKTTRRPASWVSRVVTVSSASVVVSIAPPRSSMLCRLWSWAPPARQAWAPEKFCARRPTACAVAYS